MTELTHKIIKDQGDGEVEIEIIARFVIWKPTTSIVDVTNAFQSTMGEFAI